MLKVNMKKEVLRKNKNFKYHNLLYFLFWLLGVYNPVSLNAQYLENRYLADVFNYEITSMDVTFSTNVPEPNSAFSFCGLFSGYILNVNEMAVHSKALKMNIYEPMNDTISRRPLIIICFGGGFVGGSKDEATMKWLAQGFAKRGFVAALIDYRIGMKVSDPYLSQRSVYRGIQDGRSAVRFFRADADGADNYRIDKDQIYIGGHSAGAFIAIHNGYLDQSSEIPAAALDNNYPALGNLDEAGDNQSYSGKANAIFSLAGALGDPNWIESSSDLPIIMFHDNNDPTVSSGVDVPFKEYQQLCSMNLPIVYGSTEIAQRATSLSIPNELYLYNNRGHSVHDSAGVRLYSDIIPKISTFFYNQKLKPEIGEISGPNVVCSDNSSSQYVISDPELTYIQWEITGGQMIYSNSGQKEVEIEWDENAPLHELRCIGFNKNGAQSDEKVMEIDLIESATNTFLFSNNNWTNNSNWSQSHVPLTCEHVIVPTSENMFNLFLPANAQINLNSLDLGINIQLTIPASSTLQISP